MEFDPEGGLYGRVFEYLLAAATSEDDEDAGWRWIGEIAQATLGRDDDGAIVLVAEEIAAGLYLGHYEISPCGQKFGLAECELGGDYS